MRLSLGFLTNVWFQMGGYYESNGVYFFANSDSVSSTGSVLSTTGIDLVLCDSMNLSSALLKLYLLSVWNTKIPASSLRQMAGNYIPHRDSA